MKKQVGCYAVINFKQAEEVIKFAKINNINPIIFIKYYMVSGFGVDWIKAYIALLTKSFPRHSFRLYVDCNRNYGLAIQLIQIKIDYIKLSANSIILKKIKNMSAKNKVLLNPSFNIVDLSNIKNISKKI